jgi:hypothetical protein
MLGRAARATWNGPFHIGKLKQPASVGDVLLKVLETIWRAVVGVVGLAAATVAVGAAWTEVVSPHLFPALTQQIGLDVAYDVEGVTPPPIYVGKRGEKPQRCSARYPLKITISNRSSETVREVAFNLEARHPGFSKDLSTAPAYESDAILKPGYQYIACWSPPSLNEVQANPAALEYKAKALWAYAENQ